MERRSALLHLEPPAAVDVEWSGGEGRGGAGVAVCSMIDGCILRTSPAEHACGLEIGRRIHVWQVCVCDVAVELTVSVS